MTPEEKNNRRWVRTVTLTPPSLQDNTADADRLAGALKVLLKSDEIDIDITLLRTLPDLLRKWGYRARCILCKNRGRWVLAGIMNPDSRSPAAGLAVDIGTTTVVARVIDLSTGATLAESSFDNPQISEGPDILARIHFSAQDGGLGKLNRLIIDGLNREIIKLCETCGISADDIYLVAAAGNTAMTHLFLKLNPQWIIREPYIPAVNSPGLIPAHELGIKVNQQARTIIFPNIGSYFGGDLIAGIIFSGLHRHEETAILVDVGTNAEVVLGNKDWMIACAGAAGPALEGGVTKMGMMAGPGVIDKITINTDTGNIVIHMIDNERPKGICGSGLIDLAAGLFLTGMADVRGKFNPSTCGSRLTEKEGIPHLIVVSAEESATGKDLTISQADLDSLVRSKAAMYTILETITMSVGMSLTDLATFYVAGTFGSFINPRSAISIGMIPDLPLNTYKTLGNSSIGGATMVLSSSEYAEEIEIIRDRITYLELNVNQEFMNRFSAAKFFPHTDVTRFPSVKKRKVKGRGFPGQ